jgi:hypothetical protein
LDRARWAACVAGHVIGAVSVPLTAVAGPPPPISDSPLTKIEFHLPSQLVGDALTALGQQSGLSIAVSSTLTKNLKSSPLEGRYTPTEALVRILVDTGLRAEFLDRTTVVVVAASPPVNAAPQRPVGDPQKPAPDPHAQASRDPRPPTLSSPCSSSDGPDATDSCQNAQRR